MFDMEIKILMKSTALLLITILTSLVLGSQTMETLIDDEDFILNIVAQADDGASGNGDAYINLQRNSDPASAYIRWNLNPAPTPGSFILDNESWLLGIEGNDDFRLTRRTGIFEPVIDVIRIQVTKMVMAILTIQL